MTKYKCMYCGKVHKSDSPILKKHIHAYYKIGGTFPLSEWEKITENIENKNESRILGKRNL